MMHPLRTVVLGLAVVALVVTATASPASARLRSFADARGDAPAALDIAKVKVANARHAVVVRLRVPGLRRSQLGLISITVEPRGRPAVVVTKARFDGRWHRVSLVRRGVGAVVRCRGDRVRFGTRTIAVRIPQRCLGVGDGSRRAVRVRAEVLDRSYDAMLAVPAPASQVPRDTFPDSRRGMSPWVRYR